MKTLKRRCQLCSGFCCSRVAFDTVDILPDEVKRLRILGATVIKERNQYYMPIGEKSCIFYNNGCTIYPMRPKACRDFDCAKSVRFRRRFVYNSPKLYGILFLGDSP